MHWRLIVCLVAFGMLGISQASAQNFFWSEFDLGQGGVVEGDLNIDAEIGDTGTAYLWYSPNGQDVFEGLDLDFSWETSGTVAFNSATTFDYDIVLRDSPEVVLGQRWSDFTGDAELVEENTVEGFLAINV